MSEDVKPPCVRGCTKLVLDPETREKIGEQPRLATDGHLCARCADKLLERLKAIPDLYAMLSTDLNSGDPFAPGKRGKISGSPELIRLDVLAMMDPRSYPVRRLAPGEKPPPPETVRFSGDVSGVMASWADCLCDDLNLSGRPNDLDGSIALLTGPWWSNVLYRPWVDELWTEVDEIYSTLRRLNNIWTPKPLGACACGQMLYEPDLGTIEPGKAIIECPRCNHRLNGLSVVRLKTAQTISEAS